MPTAASLRRPGEADTVRRRQALPMPPGARNCRFGDIEELISGDDAAMVSRPPFRRHITPASFIFGRDISAMLYEAA